jgi:hypothetical protein
MIKLEKVPVKVFWFIPMISIDYNLKYFYFGWLLFAWSVNYGK